MRQSPVTFGGHFMIDKKVSKRVNTLYGYQKKQIGMFFVECLQLTNDPFFETNYSKNNYRLWKIHNKEIAN